MDGPKERRSRLLGDGDINVSFEFFPPKTEKMEEALWAAIRRLEPLRPRFVSVTYGAGGSTRERTHATVARLVRETTLVPAAHLTCVQATKAEVDEVARSYKQAGVRHIVALRGDPRAGVGTKYSPHPGGYANAADLVAGLKRIDGIRGVGGRLSGAPPRQPSLAEDLDNLKAKVDAGAMGTSPSSSSTTPTICAFSSLRARTASGPRSWRASRRSTTSSRSPALPRAATPPCRRGWRGASRARANSQTTHLVAAAVAAEQVMDLVDQGIRQFHFYTLNRADLVYAICHLLGLRPERGRAADRRGGGQRMSMPRATHRRTRELPPSASSSSMAPWAR